MSTHVHEYVFIFVVLDCLCVKFRGVRPCCAGGEYLVVGPAESLALYDEGGAFVVNWYRALRIWSSGSDCCG